MELDALRKLVSAEGETLRARDGVSLDAAALAEGGLAKREAAELLAKLQPKSVPDFELDLSKASSAEVFAERFAQAVPKVDKPSRRLSILGGDTRERARLPPCAPMRAAARAGVSGSRACPPR